MIRRARQQRRATASRRGGAVALELALSLSFLVVPMMLGIWEIGCLLDAQQTLIQAVREGGRQAATGQMTNAQVQQVVTVYLGNSGVATANVAVTVTNLGSGADASQAAQLDPITVAASLPYANVSWSSTSQFVPSSTILRSSCMWYSARDVPYAAPPAAPTQ